MNFADLRLRLKQVPQSNCSQKTESKQKTWNFQKSHCKKSTSCVFQTFNDNRGGNDRFLSLQDLVTGMTNFRYLRRLEISFERLNWLLEKMLKFFRTKEISDRDVKYLSEQLRRLKLLEELSLDLSLYAFH